MASFSAELEVEGQTYPVRWCRFGFEQATHERGQVRGKVRHSLLHLTLDVPDGDQLLTWANTPHKALAGHVTFFETGRLTARETVSFATGYCVGYDETFASGDGTSGAYVCRLVISADKLELTPGGPSRPLGVAAVRDYAAQTADALAPPSAPLPVGGRGPNGFGDVKGQYSGRIYDADSCGGPIQQLDWESAQIDAAGVVLVAKHVGRFPAVQANQKMLHRLEQIANGQMSATDYDKRYYTHELREYERYKALDVPDGTDPGYEVWNDVHTATLEDYKINERTLPLYHPDITEADFES